MNLIISTNARRFAEVLQFQDLILRAILFKKILYYQMPDYQLLHRYELWSRTI